MNNLFEKFPVITFNDSICTNILAKVKFNDTTFNNASLYYPYTVKDGERPDHVALNYYGDSRFVWIVFMSNKIVDPYYEWPLDNASFKEHIANKYGSIEGAVEKISHYRVSYESDDRMLNQAVYEALTSGLKKYWRPVVSDNGSTLFYTRKEQSLVSDTNKIVELYVTSPYNYTVGENVVQSNTSGGTTASGNIKSIEPDRIIIRHVEGAFANTTGSVANVAGIESRATSAVSNDNVLYTAIPNDEYVYWEPVSFYTYEDEINTSRKFINLIDAAYVDKIEKEIQDLL